MTCMMTFLLRQSLLFLSQNRGRKFPKIWKNLEQFLLRQERPKFKNFRPSLRSGRIFKVKKFFKAKGKPIPPLSSPEIDPNGSISPRILCLGGRQNWPKPKIFIFQNFFPMTCMMTFFAKAKLAFLSQNRGLTLEKF